MAGAGKLEDPNGYSSRLSLADRMKASAMASSRMSGHQDSSHWKHLESRGDPEGPKADTCVYALGSFSGVYTP